MAKISQSELTTRERIALKLFLWLINIIQPWEYDHQQKEWMDTLKEELAKKETNNENS